MSDGLKTVILWSIIMLTAIVFIVLLIKSIKILRTKMAEISKTGSKFTYMTIVITVLIQLVLLTTYSNIVVSTSINWYGTPAANFVSLINIILIIPFNTMVSFICGYKGKLAIVLSAITGTVLTMLLILALGSTGVSMLIGK